jgi:hypothetical protein
MDWDDYLRHEAATYRQLAEKTANVYGKQELLDLAAWLRNEEFRMACLSKQVPNKYFEAGRAAISRDAPEIDPPPAPLFFG